jgi:integrase
VLDDVQVRRDPAGVIRSVELVAAKTKTRRARTIPATERLRKILVRRQRGPDGEALGPGCYVFGTETGERRKSFRGSWESACEGANVPRDDAGRLTLHFHDLRREFASRLLESGATLAEVQSALGHTSVTMTSRYLGVTDAGLQKSFERFERHREVPASVLAFKKSGV